MQEAGDLALKNLSCKAGNTHLLKLYATCCRREERGQDLTLVSWCEATQLQFILEILHKL